MAGRRTIRGIHNLPGLSAVRTIRGVVTLPTIRSMSRLFTMCRISSLTSLVTVRSVRSVRSVTTLCTMRSVRSVASLFIFRGIDPTCYSQCDYSTHLLSNVGSMAKLPTIRRIPSLATSRTGCSVARLPTMGGILSLSLATVRSAHSATTPPTIRTLRGMARLSIMGRIQTDPD